MLKIKKTKKAQTKIKEMLFMLLALALLFIIVLLFWVSFYIRSIWGEVQQTKQERNAILASYLVDTPEFNCGEPGCVDLDKAMALKGKTFYNSYWNVDGLMIERGGQKNNSVECNLGNYPNCDKITLKKPSDYSLPTTSIISLCRKERTNDYTYEKCELGRVVVWSKN